LEEAPIISAAAPVVDLAAALAVARQAAPALAVVPTTAAIHRVVYPGIPVAVTTAAAIAACIDAGTECREI
jgi:hypothetical protein